jgi:tetratricopeptide (TPR) repeat protein
MATVSPVLAKTPAEIQAVARASTVKIEHGDIIGTGVIVHRKGQVYSLITNRHVVCGGSLCSQLSLNRKYRLSLPDAQQVQVNAKSIKFLGQDLDLAVIQFSSSRSYPVVKVADLSKLKAQDAVFTAGFPLESRIFTFGEGEAIAVVNRRIPGDNGGYSIVYNAQTLPGMSGGGVFNSDGDLVAIHGQGDRFREGTILDDDSKIGSKIGLNRGISIRWSIQELGGIGIIVVNMTSPSAFQVISDQVPPVADEYFITGFNKLVDPGSNIMAGKKAAIESFNKAIQLNPNYSYSYLMRAITYRQVGEFQKSLSDYNQVIALKPDLVEAYNNRGGLKADNLNDFQGALADYNQAISLWPSGAMIYYNRAALRADKLNEPQGALADYNQAIALKPDYASAYNNRAILKENKLNDFQGALADYNQAIALKPDYASAYNNRAILKENKLNDFQGALADYNQAITLKPGYAKAYYSRAILKEDKLNDFQGALADYNQAITLNPDYAGAYNNRGLLKKDKLNDFQGALADYNQAITLKPDFVEAHNNRGLLKFEKLNDLQGALADYNRAIALKPDYAEIYNNRAILKENKLNDFQGALADYNQAIALKLDYAKAYNNRAILKADNLNDFQGALADYNRAIALKPDYANAFYNRGSLKKSKLNDRGGAIADFRQAARIYQQQGKSQYQQSAIDQLRALGASE